LNLNFKNLGRHSLFEKLNRFKSGKVGEESQLKTKNLGLYYFSFNIGFAE